MKIGRIIIGIGLLVFALFWFVALLGGRGGITTIRSLEIIVPAIIGVIILKSAKSEKEEVIKVDTSIFTAKVFVICPYCGSKTEQGITKCQKCGADL